MDSMTGNVDAEHRLKVRGGFSQGFSIAGEPFLGKGQFSIHLATGRDCSLRATNIGCPKRLVLCLRYEGKFDNALPEGNGVMTWVSGNVWEGEFKQGLIHGQGLFRSGPDSVPFEYRGGFANGNFEGHAACRCSSVLHNMIQRS